jgi:hypothetical protein
MQNAKFYIFSLLLPQNRDDFSEWNIRENREFNEFREFSGYSNLTKFPNFSNFPFE